MSSWGRSAVMNAFTVTDTWSGFLLSGRAVDTTYRTGQASKGASEGQARRDTSEPADTWPAYSERGSCSRSG